MRKSYVSVIILAILVFSAAFDNPVQARSLSVIVRPNSTPDFVNSEAVISLDDTIYVPLIMQRTYYTTSTDIILGNPITVQGTGVVINGSIATIVGSGTFHATGTLTNGMIDVNATGEVVLILDGVNITHSSGPAINVTNAGKLSVVLANGTTNTLIDGAIYTDISQKATLFSNDPLEIFGDGTLNVTGNYKHGITSDDNLIIHGGTINILSTISDGIHANDNITIFGGTITMNNIGSDGIENEGLKGPLEVWGGTFSLTVADDGLVSLGSLIINGGTIDIPYGYEGIESKNIITINGGTISANVSDDALNATNNITLNGGQLFFNGGSDAVDSNGSLTINGGVIVSLGGTEGSFDCEGDVVFNGGIVVGTGFGSNPASESSTQHVVEILAPRPVGTIFNFVPIGGVSVLTFEVTKVYWDMTITTPDLQGNKWYTIFTGGTVSGGTNFHGLYTGATYTGGDNWKTFYTGSIITHVWE